jgi:hypothetical protein
MSMDPERDEFARLLKMVHAAEDFGLSETDARAVAEEALERFDSLADACDWAAGVLARLVLMTVRRA